MSKTDVNRTKYRDLEDVLAEADEEVEEALEPERRELDVTRLRNSEEIGAEDFSARAPLTIVPTGLPSIDKILGGGMTRGMSVGIGGVYGGGKSVMLLQMATNLASSGASVLYATPELTEDEVLARCAARYASEGGVKGAPSFGSIRRMRHPDGSEFTRESRAIVRASVAAWKKDVRNRFTLLRYREGESVATIHEAIDWFYNSSRGGGMKVVVVDPIQRLNPMRVPSMPSVQYESILKSEHERIALVATQVKDLVDEYPDTCILFGSDANAGVMNPKESASAGFRGGAKVGNAATTMFFIGRPTMGQSLEEFKEKFVGEAKFVNDSDPAVCPDSGLDIGDEWFEMSRKSPCIVSTFKNREGPSGYVGMHLEGGASRFVDCGVSQTISAVEAFGVEEPGLLDDSKESSGASWW